MSARWLLTFILAFNMTHAGASDESTWPPRHSAQGHLVVTPVGNSNTFAAYSTETGQWNTFTFPEGVRATPITTPLLVAFELEGEQVKELVAVDINGSWRTHRLPRAVDGTCSPFCGNRIAWYEIDGKVHAFSGSLGRWDSIASKSGRVTIYQNNTATNSEFLLLERETSLAAFTGRFPKWAKVETVAATPAKDGAD